jgi:putative endonuclease
MMPRVSGRQWEQVAESFLRSRGLRFLERNYRCRLGEIDLVMEHADQLVFVEVRYRRSSAHGDGAESIGSRKQRRISSAAASYLGRHPGYSTRVCRFDVVSIGGNPDQASIRWIRNAFESTHG